MIDLSGIAQVITAVGIVYSIYLTRHVKHAMNSLLDARVLAAESKGAIDERAREDTRNNERNQKKDITN